MVNPVNVRTGEALLSQNRVPPGTAYPVPHRSQTDAAGEPQKDVMKAVVVLLC